MQIQEPTLVVNAGQAKTNIRKMITKAKRNGLRFRPHFKTHQSAQVGEWFRAEGVKAITVSSLRMAAYFAQNGWKDIMVAFPFNRLEMETANQLAAIIQLHLLVEDSETVAFLQQHLQRPVKLWIKIDVGYHRTGILAENVIAIEQVIQQIQQNDITEFAGFLTHAGHSYHAQNQEEILQIHQQTLQKLQILKQRFVGSFSQLECSLGDTPCCSLAEDFAGMDEMRPGNFVYYDVMQFQLGSCSYEEIAVAALCPIVATHWERNEVVIYGGAVHLSKETIEWNNQSIYGRIVEPQANGWGPIIPDAYVKSLSQEHGIVVVPSQWKTQLQVGSCLPVLPIHSCLTANLMPTVQTIDGTVLTMM